MTPNLPDLSFGRERERRSREPNAGALVFDLTNPDQPKEIGQGFTFFGRPDRRNVPSLSHQWLSEITIANDVRQAAAFESAAKAEKAKSSDIGKLLNLTMDYSCSAVGAGLRILTGDLGKALTTYSYIIVDEADTGNDSPFLVSEVWVAECDNPNASTLTPLSVRGKKFLSPGKQDQFVPWEAIAYRVLTKS